MQLTTEQQAFVEKVRDSYENIALTALAGSGKTSVLVHAAKELDPDEKTIAVAFSKVIATELQERMPKNIQCLTFNSLGHRAWQSFMGSKKLTLTTNKTGNIVKMYCRENPDLWDYWIGISDVLQRAKREGLIPANAQGKPMSYVQDRTEAWVDYMNQHGLSPKVLGGVEAAQVMFEEMLNLSINQAFEGEIDFDDQIYMSACYPAKLTKYDTILVDEVQDSAFLQYKLLEKMMDDSTRLIIAGDENQGIFAFRGASTTLMREMTDKYQCVRMPLTVSFRCPKSVIKVAQKYVPEIRAAENADEGEVRTLLDWSPETIEPKAVILCRNVAPLVRCTYRLIGNGRPAIMLGRDIGRSLGNLVKRITSPAKELGIVAFLDHLEEWRITEIQIARAKGKPDWEESVNDKVDSLHAIQRYTQAKDTEALQKGISAVFSDDAEGRILLSTIHRAKGREWGTVYLLDEWRIPSKYAVQDAQKNPDSVQMQQEMNLMYVAVTRAKQKLLYIDSRQYKGGDQDDEEETLGEQLTAIEDRKRG